MEASGNRDTPILGEQRLRRVLEAARVGFVAIDADWVIGDWNREAERVLGWSRSEVLGRSLLEIAVPEDRRHEYQAYLGGFADAGHARFTGGHLEVMGVARDGGEVVLDATVSYLPEVGSWPFQVFFQDATRRRQAEMQLHGYRDCLEGILENSPVPIVIRDAEGRTVFVSHACERLLGIPREQMVGKVPEEIFPPGQAEAIRASDRQVSESGTPLEFEQTISGPDGEHHFVTAKFPVPSADGSPPGTCTVSTDITARRDAERRLCEAESTYRALVEELPLVTYVDAVDEHSSAIYVSPQAEELLGYTVAEWLSDRELFRKVLHPEDRDRVMAEVVRTNASGEGFSEEYRLMHRDGRAIWVRDEAICVRDEAGRPLCFQGFLEDVTAQKEAERRRRELEAQLAQGARLESMGRLAGGIAHDFNNLLAVVLTHTGFVADEVGEDSPAYADLQQIRRAADHAADLVRRLLVIGRREVSRPEAMDLAELIRDNEPLLRSVAGEQVDLRLDLADGLTPVMADPGQVEQVLINLIANARDAVAVGGAVTVRVEGREADPAAVVLTVRDAGEGMSEEVAARAFEPFFTTKASGVGTGLGLATVYGIVTQAGGTVEIDSRPGQGTTVTVSLPQAGDAALTPGAAPAVTEPVRGRGETVLLVEDEDAVRVAATRILAEGGYEVVPAAGAVEALEACAERPIDLVLTDMVMPGISGPVLAKRVTELQPGAAVVFMTGYSDRRDAAGQSPVLDKPFTAEELLEAAGSAIGRRSGGDDQALRSVA